jgi:hypothetical protein
VLDDEGKAEGLGAKNLDWNLFFGTPYFPSTHVSQ